MFKKNWYLFTPLVIIVIPAALMFYYMSSFGYPPQEAWKAVKHFVQSNTRYPLGYSELKFDRITPGMDGGQVRNMLCQPSERHDKDTKWVFSLAQGSTKYYHERIIYMQQDKQGVLRVKETVKRFHEPEEEKK